MKTYIYIKDFIQSLFNSFISLLKIIVSSRPVTKLPSKINETCVILGNGPSLETSINVARERLKKSDLVCVNFFPLTPLFEELKPRFFVVCDSVIWKKDATKDIVLKAEQMFDRINERTHWEFYLFMPLNANKKGDWQKRISENNNIKIIYYNLTPIEGLSKFSYLLYKLKLGIPRPHNVLIPSIFHCINLNYSEIYILGAEHSWIHEISVDSQNNVYVGHKHFYNEQVNNSQMKKNLKENMKLHEILKTFTTAFKSYFDLDKYSKTKNVSIFNSTPSSFIDAFERKKLED